MSQVILIGFGWGLAFAVSFVALGYPTLLSFLLGTLGGWVWSTIATYWQSGDELTELPSYLSDIEALERELENIGTGGRIDLRKAQRRRDARALREKVQQRYRSDQLRHRGRPTTMGDRVQALRNKLFPPKKKVLLDDMGTPEQQAELDAIIAEINAKAPQIDAQLNDPDRSS